MLGGNCQIDDDFSRRRKHRLSTKDSAVTNPDQMAIIEKGKPYAEPILKRFALRGISEGEI
jgi:hypothetical protein